MNPEPVALAYPVSSLCGLADELGEVDPMKAALAALAGPAGQQLKTKLDQLQPGDFFPLDGQFAFLGISGGVALLEKHPNGEIETTKYARC
jgi:hypothetical protein